MFDTVVDPQPVISRLARSKDSFLSSNIENPNLTSKTSLLGHTKSLGFSPSHRRIHSDLVATAPSFHDYLILSGGGLEPAFRLSPGANSTRSRQNSSFLGTYNPTSQVLRQSRTSAGDFCDEKSNLEPKGGLCSVPLLTPLQTPIAVSHENPNSISSVLSVLISTLTVSKTTHESHLEHFERQGPNTDKYNQLGIVSIMKMPSKMKSSSSFVRMGDIANNGAHLLANASDRQFSPPSFIRPKGRKLVARREPSPLAYMPSMDSLRQDESMYSSATDGQDEGVSLSRLPVRPDVIPEEDERAHHNKMARYDIEAHYDIEGHDIEGLHDIEDHHDPEDHDYLEDHHRRVTNCDSFPKFNQTAHYNLEDHHVAEDLLHQITNSSHIPQSNQIPEQNQTLHPEFSPLLVPTPVLEQKDRESTEDTINEYITQQIDSIVETAALDDNSKIEWRTYMENYSKVRI
jgi:hypothetical protein